MPVTEARLRVALQRIGRRQDVDVVMQSLVGQRAVDIAQDLGISRGRVYQLKRRGLHHLKAELRRMGVTDPW